MRKSFTKFFAKFFVFAFVLLCIPSLAWGAISHEMFLEALYDARGVALVYTNEPNPGTRKPAKTPPRPPRTRQEKADAALRMGFAGMPLTGITKVETRPVGNLTAPITRVNAVRFAVQSLGLSFEALALSGIKPAFSDIGGLSDFERGCLTVAQKMVPQIWGEGGGNFSPQKPLERAEMQNIINAVANASKSLLLELHVSPAKGITMRFHREGAFSGAPKWRLLVHGFDSEEEAEAGAAQIAIPMSPNSFNYEWRMRSELMDDWRKVEELYSMVKGFGRDISIVPAVTNSENDNMPRFWISAVVEKNLFDVNMLLPPQGIRTLAPVSQMRRGGKDEPVLAMNAGYFTWTGRDLGVSIGALVTGGDLINAPYLDRTTIGWSRGSAPMFDSLTWSQSVKIPFSPDESFSTINQFSLKGGTFLVAYTPHYTRNGRKTPKPELAVTELVLKDGVCIAKGYGESTVDEGTIILASYGVKAVLLDNKKVGDKVEIDFSLSSSFGNADAWAGIEEAVQAGPMILRNGIVSIRAEGFEASFVNGRHPRTAVGSTAKGDWIFFIGDGRNGIHSIGFSLVETASIMQEIGAANALNLDGGGSSEILLRGKFFNFPSEGRERPVSNAIGVFSRP